MKTPALAIANNQAPSVTTSSLPGPSVLSARRFGHIVAFKDLHGGITAFHSNNLEVAEISEELYNQMPEVSLLEAVVPETLLGKSSSVISSHTSADHAENLGHELEVWNKEINPETVTQVLKNTIRALTINTTQICNLACAYCAAGGDGTYNDAVKSISIEKTIPQLKFFIDKVPAHGTFHITFLGGEPLLYPQALVALGTYAQELCREKEINLSIKIITNGTLITEKIARDLAPLRPSWNISIDGPKALNDIARPSKNGKSSTDMTMKGLEHIFAMKSEWSDITLHAVFNGNNLDVKGTYEFFKSLGVNSFEFTLDVYEKDPVITEKFIEGMNAVAALAYSTEGETGLRKILTFDQHFESLDQQIRRESHCGSGKSLLSIDARNQVFTCPLEVSHKENLVGVGSYVKQEALEQLQNPFIELNNCNTCWARFVCGGGCLYNHKALTGDLHTKHPQYCLKTRSLLKTAILYYKQSRS